MKFLAVILAMWSLTAFSVEFLAGKEQYNKGSERFIHWHGTGSSTHNGNEYNYLASLIYRAIGANKFMLQLDIFHGDAHKRDRMVFVKAEGQKGFFKVYTYQHEVTGQPTEADVAELAEVLPDSYTESGWAFVAEGGNLYSHGNGTMTHLHYDDDTGMLYSNGANMGRNKMWSATLKQIFKQ